MSKSLQKLIPVLSENQKQELFIGAGVGAVGGYFLSTMINTNAWIVTPLFMLDGAAIGSAIAMRMLSAKRATADIPYIDQGIIESAASMAITAGASQYTDSNLMVLLIDLIGGLAITEFYPQKSKPKHNSTKY